MGRKRQGYGKVVGQVCSLVCGWYSGYRLVEMDSKISIDTGPDRGEEGQMCKQTHRRRQTGRQRDMYIRVQ